MEKKLLLFVLLCLLKFTNPSYSQNNNNKPIGFPTINTYNFFLITDEGRVGRFDQKTVALQMSILADKLKPAFIISSGDTFHDDGVSSTSDTLWKSNFEDIYYYSSLQIDWYPVLGNHEYHGNSQALIDYSNIDKRWKMPARYYTLVKTTKDNTKIRLIFIDTSPFVEQYRTHQSQYPDILTQDYNKQLKWIDSVLNVSTEKWKIVIGHHPIYSVDAVHGDTPELIEKLKPLLIKYKVDFYCAGHIHNFQHLKEPGVYLDYIVTTSGAQSRPAFSGPMTKFADSSVGFSLFTLKSDTLSIFFINGKGNVIYHYDKTKN